MSTHLLIAAAYLEGLPQGTKLALMAVADSGDEQTLLSAPGLPKVRAWSGLSKSQALAVIAQLTKPVADGGLGLIERVEAGRLGRRATFRVFPNGVPAIPHPAEVAARYDDEGGSGQQDPQVIPRVGDDAAQEGPASTTLGSGLTPSRVRPAGPLQSSTSVSSAQRPAEPVETRRSASGFPGSRASSAEAREEAQGIARRARGANDQPCPIHPAMIVPCGRCANEASKVTPERRAAHAKRLREAAARASTTAPVAPPTDTEERTA